MEKKITNKVKKDLKAFIDGLIVKKRKSTGKKYFFDVDGFLVLDIVVKTKLVFTHKSSFKMLKDIPDSEAQIILNKTLNDLGFDAEGICFMDGHYPSERQMFDSYPFPYEQKLIYFKCYQVYQERDMLVTIKN